MTVPSMNTIDLLLARDLKEEPATKSEIADLVKYYRWLRAQVGDDFKPEKDDLPKKSAKEFLLKQGSLKPKPQEEVRRA